MRKLILIFFLLIGLFVQSQAQSLFNAVALENGARWISVPPSYTPNSERKNFQNYSPDALLDNGSSIWCSKQGAALPFEFVIELAEPFSIRQLVFNNNAEKYDGICSKNVRVEFSLTSASSGYEEVQEFTLSPNQINTFEVNAIQARWIKLTVLSNYGNNQYTELNEFSALGTPRHTEIQPLDIGGTWETNWQIITFSHTSPNTFKATYSYDKNNSTLINGTVTQGNIERNRLEFKWFEGQLKGTSVLYMNAEGNRLSGKWWNDKRADDFGLWIMERKEAKPIQAIIKQDPATFDQQPIELGKKVILKHVLFQQSKAELLPGSEEELNQLVKVLKENPNLKVDISGHTDNVGNAALNLQLSEDRVKMIKNYLIKNNIEARRIKGKGYGGTQPIADNSNPETRPLNRRVEFTLF